MDAHRAQKLTAILIIFSFMLILSPRTSAAAGLTSTESVVTRTIQLSAGKSMVMKTDTPIKRVSIANPAVADFILLSPGEIYLTGKAAGSTNITLWQDGGLAAVYDLNVGFDVAALKQQLNELLPSETDLQVMSVNNSLTLAGKVTNAANMNQVMSLARSFVPEDHIQNLVQVGGVQQVMLEVRIAEITKSLSRELGINFLYSDGTNFVASTLGNLSSFSADILKNTTITAAPTVNTFFRFSQGGYSWTGLIDALKSDGLVKVLAEPTLITLSGQSANFLVGGEFPVPVSQGSNNGTTIEYKTFGIELSFSPTVLSTDKISMKVNPSISDIDYSTQVMSGGVFVPGLKTRKASTTIELGDGQSFAIAGLLSNSVISSISKWPFLGEIPVLGALFQSKTYQRKETELVIIVTPHLVKPLNMARQSLPTDNYVEPTEAEFYLLGRLQGFGPDRAKSPTGDMDGDFGHSMPSN